MPDAFHVLLLALNTVIMCLTFLACAWAKQHADTARAGGLLACNERRRAEKAADRAATALALDRPATLPFPAPAQPEPVATLPFVAKPPALRLCQCDDAPNGLREGAD